MIDLDGRDALDARNADTGSTPSHAGPHVRSSRLGARRMSPATAAGTPRVTEHVRREGSPS
jgi:hypothetical protein